MISVWVLIFAAPYCEALGIAIDDDGEDEQALDELLSIPAIVINRTSKELLVAPNNHLQIAHNCLPQYIEPEPFQGHDVSGVTPKLYKLFSVYRF